MLQCISFSEYFMLCSVQQDIYAFITFSLCDISDRVWCICRIRQKADTSVNEGQSLSLHKLANSDDFDHNVHDCKLHMYIYLSVFIEFTNYFIPPAIILLYQQFRKRQTFYQKSIINRKRVIEYDFSFFGNIKKSRNPLFKISHLTILLCFFTPSHLQPKVQYVTPYVPLPKYCSRPI